MDDSSLLSVYSFLMDEATTLCRFKPARDDKNAIVVLFYPASSFTVAASAGMSDARRRKSRVSMVSLSEW